MRLAPGDFDRDDEAAHADQPPRDHHVGNMHRAGEPPRASGLSFQQLASIFRRRIGLILAIAALGTLVAGAVGLLIPPKYTAKAEILVEPKQAGLVDGQAAAVPPADAPAIETQVTMLASRDHLQRVLDSLSRDRETAAPAMKPSGEAVSSGPEITEKRPDPATTKIAMLSLDDLERYLRVGQERTSRVIGVSFTATDPKKAALIANRVVQLYVESQSEQKRLLASRELARLDERIAQLKDEVEQSGVGGQKLIQQRLLAGQSADDGRAAEIRLRELGREAVARDQLYANLLRRQKEIRYLQETVAPDVRILSLASPPDRPSSPSPFLFIFPAFIVFSMCGCSLAVVAERLDRGMRSEQDVHDALGLSCLGLVSQLSRKGRIRPHKFLLRHPFAPYTEAIRSVVAGLRLATPHQASKIILATSSVPGEGKTTLAVSLAVYVAQLRRRVLLVDLDFRNPSILRALRVKAKLGIVDLLLHDLPPADVIQRIPHLGLDYLPMTRCPVDPVALLAGDQLSRLLHQLRKSYDCVIVDGPPLLGVTETRLLASLVDKVLFVVKWGSTRQEAAQNAVNLLRDSGCFDRERASHPSVVLAQVDLKEHARYRYGDVSEYLVTYGKYYSNSTIDYRRKLALPKPSTVSSDDTNLFKATVSEA